MQESQNSQVVLRKAMWLFFIIFLSISTLVAGLIHLFYRVQTGSHLDGLLVREQQAIALESHQALQSLGGVLTDLVYLRHQNELQDFFEGDHQALDEVANEYLHFALAKQMYDQIRLIDLEGQELVRINLNDGRARRVPRHELQNKAHRYYVKNTLTLGPEEIFVSPLDLNMEHGKVEYPLKPMLRFVTPVYDSLGKRRGIIVLNYKAQSFLNHLRNIGSNADGDSMLLNQDGHWLLSPQREDEWGFMFAERKDRTFGADFPTEWHTVLDEPTGQFLTDQGLFTYTTLFPFDQFGPEELPAAGPDLREVIVSNSNQGFWKLVSHIPTERIGQYGSRLKTRLMTLGAALLLLAATGSAFIALALSRHRLYQAQLEVMAHFDLLTGLPNRALFFDRLIQTLEQARRYDRPFGLLYIDLDNFKDVNDTLGHDAGDQLLAIMGKRLQNVCRKADTVGRLGGDEFVVLLSEVEGRPGCEAVAEKILEGMKEPVRLRGATRVITVSIGIGLYPEDGETADDLLTRSDQAMYQSKMKGKNQYR